MTQFVEVPDGARLFDTPEEAALSGWASAAAARARVVDVQPTTDETEAVWVTLQLGDAATGFQDQDIVTCSRTPDDRWWVSGSTGASSGLG